MQLVEQIRPLLVGKDPVIQSGALAELISYWLAGHIVINSKDQTLELRAKLFATHCALVRDLTALNSEMLDAEFFDAR